MVQNSSARWRSICNKDDTGGKRVRIADERFQDSRFFDTRKQNFLRLGLEAYRVESGILGQPLGAMSTMI